MLTNDEKKRLDKRYQNLFGPSDFMTEEFNYRCVWEEQIIIL